MVKVGTSKSSQISSESREVIIFLFCFVFKIAASIDDAQIYTHHFSLCGELQTSALFRGLGGMETGRDAETRWPVAEELESRLG